MTVFTSIRRMSGSLLTNMPPQEKLRPLTEKTYLGVGYFHNFIHDKKGTVTSVLCTQEEYEALSRPNPVNPTLADHTWWCSEGGTIRVDTPDGKLGEDEYAVIDDKVYVRLGGKADGKALKILESDKVVDGKVDENLWL